MLWLLLWPLMLLLVLLLLMLLPLLVLTLLQGKRCSMPFAWADTGRDSSEAPHTAQALGLRWERCRPPLFSVLRRSGGGQGGASIRGAIRADDVGQGAVGDCWFVSALAVLAASRPDLVLQLLPSAEVSPSGCYAADLFLDGGWSSVLVDDSFPISQAKKSGGASGRGGVQREGGKLAFCRGKEGCLWPCLIEKAYAKEHASFAAISGGEIHEALLDLTGLPTETVSFSSQSFDSEVSWLRLLSWHEAGFPQGCATSVSADGIVGNHAYSLLEVREIAARPAEQTKLQFGGSSSGGGSSEGRVDPEDAGGLQLLRFCRIRNPWGKTEWKGAWSDSSSLWSARLKKELGRTELNDGTFWMLYSDFICRFTQVDVCKAHKGWFSMSLEGCAARNSLSCTGCFELEVPATAWTYLMLLQKTKRGKAKQKYFMTDLTLVLCKLTAMLVLRVTPTVVHRLTRVA